MYRFQVASQVQTVTMAEFLFGYNSLQSAILKNTPRIDTHFEFGANVTRRTKTVPSPYDDVRIGNTEVGKGVFALKAYHINWVIGEIQGDMIDDPTYVSDYCFDAGNSRTLEPYEPFRYLNHSCEPNCEWEWLEMKSEESLHSTRRLILTAVQLISLGDELTIDYNWSAKSPIRCQCHSPSCRGWIVCPEELESLRRKLTKQE